MSDSAFALLFIGLGVAYLAWARWLPRQMAAVRAAAIRRGMDPGEEVMQRHGMLLALLVATVCGWLSIIAGGFLLAAT